MPEELNAAWEYWTPSEEWEEAFGEEKPVQEWLGDGFKFGAKQFECQQCRMVFHRMDNGRVYRYCSRKCYAEFFRRTTKCVLCRTPFSTRWTSRMYCSRRCSEAPKPNRKALMSALPIPYSAVRIGQKLHLRGDALESSVCGCEGVVTKIEPWGVHLDLVVPVCRGSGELHKPKYRALWEEIVFPNTNGQSSAKSLGYTGSVCGKCGSTRMVRTGTCERCEECGETSGGCG